MNSLQDLNNFYRTVPVTDNRTSRVTFNRASAINQVVNVSEGSHTLPLGIEITKVINPSNVFVTLSVSVLGVLDNNATVEWPVVPDGFTTSIVNKLYTISGNCSLSDWNIIKQAVITIPSNTGTYLYTATLNVKLYNVDYKTFTWTNTVTLINYPALSDPSDFIYQPYAYADSFGRVKNHPVITDAYDEDWTLTVTPNYPEAVELARQMSADEQIAGIAAGGNFQWNPTTHEMQYWGTKAGINILLNNTRFDCQREFDFEMTYYASNSTTQESATKIQQFRSNSENYISQPTSSDTYQLNTPKVILNGPRITNTDYEFDNPGQGVYLVAVQATPDTALLKMDSFSEIEMQYAINDSIHGFTQADSVGDITVMSSDGNTIVSSNDTVTFIWHRTSADQSLILEGTLLIGTLLAKQIDINSDGTILTIARSYQGDSAKGGLYVYKKTNSTWSLENHFLSGLTTITNQGVDPELYDFSVAISDDGLKIALGIPGGVGGDTTAPKVQTYTRPNSSSSWTVQDLPQPLIQDDLFGKELAISGDGLSLVVKRSPVTTAPANRTSYIRSYHWVSNSWTYVAEFSSQEDYLGDRLELNYDGTVLVLNNWNINNAAGEVWVRTRASNSDAFSSTQILTPDSINQVFFGWAIAISDQGDTILVGAPYPISSGFVNVYRLESGTWFLDHTEYPASANTFKWGNSVAINSTGTRILIGHPRRPSINTDYGRIVEYRTVGWSYWDTNDQWLLIYGTKAQCNSHLSNLTITPATGYNQNFRLVYKALMQDTSGMGVSDPWFYFGTYGQYYGQFQSIVYTA